VRMAGDSQYARYVRHIRIDWREATGCALPQKSLPSARSSPSPRSTTSRPSSRRPCKARQLAQSLWNGEEFYLQLDAHMRFVRGWDTQLTAWLATAELTSPKAVLSTYPSG
jgi:hypothetical protein